MGCSSPWKYDFVLGKDWLKNGETKHKSKNGNSACLKMRRIFK